MSFFYPPITASSCSEINSICIGSGRFLRSVLVPALVGCNKKEGSEILSSRCQPVIFQTRGRTFLDYYSSKENDEKKHLTYEVDTVFSDGKIETDHVEFYGVGTLGCDEGMKDALKVLDQMKEISVIGVGVTEAGLSSPPTQAMFNLLTILRHIHTLLSTQKLKCPNPNKKISVINTDNLPRNGSVIRSHMLQLAGDDTDFCLFLENGIVFHDTMVDRITAQREGSNGLVPKCEPVPMKALVIEDLGGDLPEFLNSDEAREKFGVITRNKPGELNSDIQLKLRIANGTHTALSQTMALCSLPQTSLLSSPPEHKHHHASQLLLQFVDSYFDSQVLPGLEEEVEVEMIKAVYYKDWKVRLCHANFGLSTFFIAQNVALKGGLRISPTIESLIRSGKPVTVATAFVMAAILRYITPAIKTSTDGVYRGWLDGFPRTLNAPDKDDDDTTNTVTYVNGLKYNLQQGWYDFQCNSSINLSHKTSLSEALYDIIQSGPKQPHQYQKVVQAYLMQKDGGNLESVSKDPMFDNLVGAVSTLYARMVVGDGMLALLQEMTERRGVYTNGFDTDCQVLCDCASRENSNAKAQPLHYRPNPIPDSSALMDLKIGQDDEGMISSVVLREVSSVKVIDLHTHLLPPSHGSFLCLWGIDELLTYHYLVAEYFMTAPSDITPEGFFQLSKQTQADMIWKSLFLDRCPISEACRGVLTTLKAFGLEAELQARDLDAIRAFYNNFRKDGLEGAERFCDLVYDRAGVRYAIMTNIPFDSNEAQHWRPKRKEYTQHFRSALRVDPLLAGDRKTIETALKLSGYENTLEGTRQYLRDWCDTMKPEYMMASTPHNFVFADENAGNLSGVQKKGVNEDALKEPFAFTDATSQNADCCDDGDGDASASIINEDSDLLTQVLMKVCEELDLPIALKIGAHRGVNPQLQSAGDGIVAFADAGVLARLCTRFPKVRFLATFLSNNNQHEACVLASKFRNLHIYGCWWYCNNPSLIWGITKMRVEMLGTAFTAQHSDARVLDQLVYKWAHSRRVIGGVLSEEMEKMVEGGYIPTRGEIRRDIERLFGGSYEEFMSKSFV